MAGFSTEVKVGIFVMIGIIALAHMTIRLGKFHLTETSGYQTWTIFDDAMGLKKNAPVEMAGIQIGLVEKIELDNGRAKLYFRIQPEVKITIDSLAYIRTRGVLGDKYISIETGNPWAPLITNGQELPRAKILNEDLDQIIGRIGIIANDIKEITTSLRISVASPESQKNIKESLDNIRELTTSLRTMISDNQNRLNRTMKNIENFTIDLAQISKKNKKAFSEMVKNFLTISGQLGQTISGLSSIVEKVDKGEGSLGTLINERETTEQLNATLTSLNQITHKINEGKGSIGKLVNDESIIIKIDETLTGINEYLSRADAWRLNLDYRGEFMFNDSTLLSTLNLKLQPKFDKFYLLGIINDPIGRRSEKIITTNHYVSGQSWQATDKITQFDKNSLKLNAQIGKRFNELTIRAGLLSSKGGLGIDYYLWEDNLRFFFEGYDFRADEKPHLRAGIDCNFWKYFFLTIGIDNFLADKNNSQLFAGAGVTFYDDDLKFLLTNAPRL